jgi:hypothetical protein
MRDDKQFGARCSPPAHASVSDAHREALQQVARAMRAVTAGEQAQARETQKLAGAQRLSQGRRLKM